MLKESQQSAIEKADQLAERLQDAASKSSLEQATTIHDGRRKALDGRGGQSVGSSAQAGPRGGTGRLPGVA